MLIIALGATVAILFRQFGIELIVMAQAFTVVLAPFVGLMIFLVTGNMAIMGKLKNGHIFRILGILGLGMLFLLAVVYAAGLMFDTGLT
jgi:Mn2+/Fe2+ NRAMP family transporter